MSDGKTKPTGQGEPSMEEILASIRRIISEDGGDPAKAGAAPAAPGGGPPPGGSDVLELTDIVEEKRAQESAPTPMQAAPIAPAPGLATAVREPEGLLSAGVAAVTTGALASLVSAKKETERAMTENPMPIGNGAMTLEGLIREEIRPILKQWLDTNLPPLVEKLVQREIQRIARGAEND